MIAIRLFTFLIVLIICKSAESDVNKKLDLKKDILPPCQACKALVNSFLKGMSNTNKKHFGGGDTAWEEEKLGDYAKSEVRLIEVQETLCSEIQRGQQQCYKLAEEWEQLIEEWWFSAQNDSLFEWLCIEKIKHCCPENHFGPECTPCEGYPGIVCSNNGKCKGSGTRKGNGECICNRGYGGHKCNSCAEMYFESYKDDNKLLCSKCHSACKGSCYLAGPKGKNKNYPYDSCNIYLPPCCDIDAIPDELTCTINNINNSFPNYSTIIIGDFNSHIGCKECNAGWIKDPDHGCLDINECATLDPCKKSEFCVNNEGSFTCLACDQSCDGCHGDGPDMCNNCAAGFLLKDGLCIAKDLNKNMEWIRYLTYLGLCIATCIIFQKNTVIASFVGLSVAIYVSASEYMLHKLSNESLL